MSTVSTCSRLARKLQRGFTLLELAVVALFLALLSVFALSTFSTSGTAATRANGLWDGTGKIADAWALLVQTCGISQDVTATVVSTGTASSTAAKNLSLLVGNAGPVAGALTTCYVNSGIRPLSGLTSGAQGAESMQGFPITLVKGTLVSGEAALSVTYGNVPDSVVLPLFNRYSSQASASSATTLPSTADTTDPLIQFGALAAGVRTLTIIKAL